MHIQSHHSLIASLHVFGFLCFCLCLLLLLDGRRGRASDEYLKRRHPGLHVAKRSCTSTRVHPSGLTQPSIGELPHCIARAPAGIALPLLVLLFSSPIGSQSNAPAPPPVQHYLHS